MNHFVLPEFYLEPNMENLINVKQKIKILPMPPIFQRYSISPLYPSTGGEKQRIQNELINLGAKKSLNGVIHKA